MTSTDQHPPRTPERDPGAALDARRVCLPGYREQVGSLAHLAAERSRPRALQWEHFDVTPVGATIGGLVEAAWIHSCASVPMRWSRCTTSHGRSGTTLGVTRVQGCAPVGEPDYQCRFQWQDDSVAFRGNRAVQHDACSDCRPEVRVMERASIVGDAPR